MGPVQVFVPFPRPAFINRLSSNTKTPQNVFEEELEDVLEHEKRQYRVRGRTGWALAALNQIQPVVEEAEGGDEEPEE